MAKASTKKPIDLGGLIQSKEAPRPAGVPTRTPTPDEPRAKALTLRLTMTQYERLRAAAFKEHATHQDLLERALLAELDRLGV